MSEQHNIDQIFSAAAKGYSASTPSGAWGRMDAVLKAKRQKRRLTIWFVSVGLGILASILGLWFYNSANNHSTIETESNIIKSNTTNFESKADNANNEITQQNITNEQATANSLNTEDLQNSNNKNIEEEIAKESIIDTQNSDIELDNSNKENTTKTINKEVAVIGLSSTNNRLPAKYSEENNADNNQTEEVAVIERVNLKSSFGIIKENSTENNIQEIVATNVIIESDSISESTQTEKTLEDNTIIDTLITEEAINPSDNVSETETEEIQKLADPVYIPNADKFKMGLFINIYAGVSLSNGASSEPYYTNFKMASSPQEYGASSPNIGFNLGFRISKKFSVSLGMKRYNHVIKGDFSMPDKRVTHINIDKFGYTSLGYYSVDNINNAMQTKNFNTVEYLREFTQTKVKLRFVEIPLNIGYNMSWKNWTLMPHLGFNTTFILSNEVQIGDDSDYYLYGEIQDLRQNIFGASAGLDFYYNTKSKLSFGLRTDFVYYLNDINTSEDFNFRPYSFLISPQISLRF